MPDADPAEQNRGGGSDHQNDEGEADDAVPRELREEASDFVRAAAHRPGRGEPDVGDGPARNHGVERQDADAGRHPECAEQPPPAAGRERGERADRTEPRAPAEGDLAGHERRADQEDAGEIDDHERGPAALSDLGREPPDVAQPDGRAGRGQDEPGSRAPHAARRGRAHLGRSSRRWCGRLRSAAIVPNPRPTRRTRVPPFRLAPPRTPRRCASPG